MNRNTKAAVIGGGPRGLAVLERCGIELRNKSGHAPVEILLIDDCQPGAGRIWRTTQGPHVLMNTISGQVTLYSGPPDAGLPRPGHGPSLYEWMRDHPNPDYARATTDTYAPRHVYGEYLRSVLAALIANFPRPHRARTILGRVIDVIPRGARYELVFENGGAPVQVDAITLATGHATARPSAEEASWLEFCATSRRCRYLSGDSSADLGLERIGPQERVGVIGLGLGFHDILAELTAGRGGRFQETNDGPVYVSSGREPRIVAGSRSGLPIPARGANQKTSDRRVSFRFFNAAAVEAARNAARSARGSNSLSFRDDLYPLIQAEMQQVYYATYVRRQRGPEVASDFEQDHATRRNPRAAMPGDLLRQYELEDVPLLDLGALARPFAGTDFPSQDAFREALTTYLQRDRLAALEGNVDNPLKAALDVLRDVRDTLRSAVEFEGLNAASFEGEFQRDFAPLASLLSAGPPASRVSELLSIQKADILTIIGPGLTVRYDRDADCFRMSSPAVPGSNEPVTILIDSRVPFPSLTQSQNPLLESLRRRGLVRPYHRSAEGGRWSKPGGIDVVPDRSYVIGRDGTVNRRILAIGLPIESPRWFTQVGSATPGSISRFTLDAQAVGKGIIEALNEATTGGRPELEAVG